MPEVSGAYLAALTGKAWKTVKTRIEAAGIKPRRRERNADLFESAPALAAIYAGDAPSDAGEFDTQRERLAAAQAEKYEHENAIRRHQIAWMPEVDQAVAEVIGNARARILGIGPKLGPQLVNIGHASIIATAIRTECYAALAELEAYDPAGSGLAGGGPPLVEDLGAATGPDGQPVGRPRKAPVQRKQRGARNLED